MLPLKNKKHELFCNEYIIDFNQTRAYSDTYPDSKYNSSRTRGGVLLTNIDIQERIRELLDEKLTQIGVRQDAVLKELAGISFSDITNYVEVNGNTVLLKDFNRLEESQRKVISEVSQIFSRDGEAIIKFKLYNKTPALELLGKYLDLFRDKMDHTLDGNIKIEIVSPEIIQKEFSINGNKNSD